MNFNVLSTKIISSISFIKLIKLALRLINWMIKLLELAKFLRLYPQEI